MSGSVTNLSFVRARSTYGQGTKTSVPALLAGHQAELVEGKAGPVVGIFRWSDQDGSVPVWHAEMSSPSRNQASIKISIDSTQ